MGYQAPNFIYPTPDTPQYGQALLAGTKEGAMMGFSMGGKIKEIKKQDALDADISKITTEAQTKLDSLKPAETVKPAEATPQTMQNDFKADPSLAQNLIDSTIKPDKALMMSGSAPLVPPVTGPLADTKPVDEIRNKRIEINADMHNKLIQTYRKHGKVEEAQAMEDKFMGQTLAMAKIDHKVASKIWNSSFLKDNYGEIDLTPKPDFSIHGDHGSYVMVDKTSGSVTTITNPGQLKEIDPEKDVYTLGADGTWNQVKLGKPKEKEGDRKLYQEHFEKGITTWLGGKGIQPETDESGKPDFTKTLSKNLKSEIKGMPGVTVEQYVNKANEIYSNIVGQKDETPASAWNKTLNLMNSNIPETRITIPGIPKEHMEKASTAAAKSMTEGAVDVGYNQKTGQLQAVYSDGTKKIIYNTNAQPTTKPTAKPAAAITPKAAETDYTKFTPDQLSAADKDWMAKNPNATSAGTKPSQIQKQQLRKQKDAADLQKKQAEGKTYNDKLKQEAIAKRSKILQMNGMSKAEADAQAAKDLS
ncbi:MAG: hypothetical protein WC332_09025 [Clostridia bacterium]|jgi:hypothetical protein